jgi:hypothetical protein
MKCAKVASFTFSFQDRYVHAIFVPADKASKASGRPIDGEMEWRNCRNTDNVLVNAT